MTTRAIVWFRQDLRLHDHEALHDAIRHADEVIPVFVVDPRVFQARTSFGFPKTGIHRARFILESLDDLRNRLRAKGADLIIRTGKPEIVLFDLVKQLGASWVFCNRERTRQEVNVQDALEHRLWTIGRELRYSRGKMLYYTQDLPFPVTHTPDTFTQFRNQVERVIQVRAPLPTPDHIPWKDTGLPAGALPDLSDLGWSVEEVDRLPTSAFRGGESPGLDRLQEYLWTTHAIATYKETRNGSQHFNDSSKFSPWLAQGCLSPKMVYAELKSYEEKVQSNESTYWLFFELLWRDNFRLIGKKYGDDIFKPGGLTGRLPGSMRQDEQRFHAWATGNTGVPFVDSHMRELNATGFMSNRGRQVTASFLIHHLELDWRMGAEYFESKLLDYDPCSNYGNWNYLAGVGTDPRADRVFNPWSQGQKYDSEGCYVKQWVPELKDIPASYIHQPESIPEDLAEELGFCPGRDYPVSFTGEKIH
ncbi:MAG: DASH family cryptochrome [Lewinellaceae bacterium]|nr:DASH family cryptochrome [Saprospiraceae bacterium]MCB9311604.1 DASH family cryptochrome [Lewinellaceae bacterium]